MDSIIKQNRQKIHARNHCNLGHIVIAQKQWTIRIKNNLFLVHISTRDVIIYWDHANYLTLYYIHHSINPFGDQEGPSWE
jgi:hypothetical protein